MFKCGTDGGEWRVQTTEAMDGGTWGGERMGVVDGQAGATAVGNEGQ